MEDIKTLSALSPGACIGMGDDGLAFKVSQESWVVSGFLGELGNDELAECLEGLEWGLIVPTF